MTADAPMTPDARRARADAYAEHRESMYAAAGKVLRADPDDVADAVQAAISEVMRRGSPDSFEDLGAYLRRAAHNRAVDIVKKNRRTRELRPTIAADTQFDDKVMGAVVTEEMMSVLNEQEALVIRERVIRARPAKQIAAELGVKPQRISQIVNKALEKLEESPAFISKFENGPRFSDLTTPDGKGLA